MDVSIIIVNYKTLELLIDAVNSVHQKSEGFSYEIIVVDNNSMDNSEQILSERYGDKVRYVALPANIGFGRANNEGIKIAQGRNVLFLNPDIVLINNAIKILMNYLDNNIGVGVVGGNLYNPKLLPAYSYCRPLPCIFTEEISLFTKGLTKKLFRYPTFNYSNSPMEVGSVSGADLMISRALLDEIGYFDSQFFMYYEETELNWRVKRAGYRCVNVPDAKFIHIDGGSLEFKEHKFRFSLESRAKYYTKTKCKLYRDIADILLLLAINVNIIALRLFRKDFKYYSDLKKIVKELYFN